MSENEAKKVELSPEEMEMASGGQGNATTGRCWYCKIDTGWIWSEQYHAMICRECRRIQRSY